MRSQSSGRSRWSVAMIAVACGVATAQEPPADSPPPASESTPAPEVAPAPSVNPLSGPAVVDGAEPGPGGSLVQRDFDGKVRKLDERPEAAALRLLELSEEERSATDAVLAERSALLDKLVSDNLLLLTRLQTARSGGDAAERRAVFAEAREVFAPLSAKGSLEDQLARGLTPENAERFRAMCREYWAALIDEPDMTSGERGGMGAGMAAGRGGAMARVGLEALGAEIKGAYDRVSGERLERLEQFTSELQLTPEQQGTIRNLFIQHAQETQRKATGLQKAALFLKIRRELTPEQRDRFYEIIREQRGAAK